MSISSIIKNVFLDPRAALEYFCSHHLPGKLGDKMFLKQKYKEEFGRRLNLRNPKLFTEKMQWLKLYDRNPLYTKLADKYAVRDYIKEKVGEEYLIPLLGVWDSFDEIDFTKLPNQFVLKCTHDSKSIIICKDKRKLNIENAKRFFETKLTINYYSVRREHQYKDIIPRIICEEYKEDESREQLKDYKIWCFNGNPKLIQLDYDRFTNHKRNVYDIEWNYLPLLLNYPNDSTRIFEQPSSLTDMLVSASKLSKNIPFLRVDFYIADTKLFVGELTSCPSAGFVKFYPYDYNAIFGEILKLPLKKCM